MKRKLAFFLTWLFIMMVSSSCIYERYDELDPDNYIPDGKTAMFFNIHLLATRETTGIQEKVKSLRVIVLNKDSIECNTFIDFGNKIYNASDFEYNFRWLTKPGTKQILVFANEESVSEINYKIPDPLPEGSIEILPEAFPNQLSDLLNMYRPDSDYEQALNSQELLTILDYVAFQPEYTIPDDSTIFLPYSTSYPDIEVGKATTKPIDIHLVPVATKFIFKFVNYRQNRVKINGISMSSANQSNYLMGQPSQDELTKDFNDTEYYWVDWLAKISCLSWGYPGFTENENFNGEVGWIEVFEMPDLQDAHIFTFIAEDSDQCFTIDEATEKVVDQETIKTPGCHTTNVYYLPESRNLVHINSDDEGQQEDSQIYYLTILLEDMGQTTAPPFRDVEIPNLKSLFRNTYVRIELVMREGDIELYAEIADWNHKTANGWVNEGNAPDDLF